MSDSVRKSSVTVGMGYRNAPEAIEWLCRVFGFEKHAVYPGPNNTIAHSELTVGGGMIMIGSVQESPFSPYTRQPDELGGAETRSVNLIVDDADAVYPRAKDAGAKIIFDIEDKHYGGRGFTCRAAGAFSPRGATLNLQIEHSFSPHFRLRSVYTDSPAVGLVVLDPESNGDTNEIVLNGDGKSRYRQLEVTGRFTWKDSQQLNVTYTRSRSEGNLNTFDSFLGNFPGALIRPDIYSNLPADDPNRFLVWGHVKTHVWGLEVLPIVEFRTGFPYATLDAMQDYVGVPYRNSTRFPDLFSADARIVKNFTVSPKYTLRVSLTTTNISNHFNALAVHDNIADPECGVFFGNYHRRYRGDFEVLF